MIKTVFKFNCFSALFTPAIVVSLAIFLCITTAQAGPPDKAVSYLKNARFYADFTEFRYEIDKDKCTLTVIGDRTNSLDYIYWKTIPLSELNYNLTDFEGGKNSNGSRYYHLMGYCIDQKECSNQKVKNNDGSTKYYSEARPTILSVDGEIGIKERAFIAALRDVIKGCGGSGAAY